MAEAALTSEDFLKATVEALSGSSRIKRQHAAAALAEVARKDVDKVSPYVEAIVDALNRPEARTRWECLDALTALVPTMPEACDDAVDGAEASLFDEDNGPVRLAAMRFLCKLGAVSQERSARVWPLIDEGVQCYHGDVEFNDMLTALTEFSQGKLSDDVRKALVARMSFDAENGKGNLKRRATQIIQYVQAETD